MFWLFVVVLLLMVWVVSFLAAKNAPNPETQNLGRTGIVVVPLLVVAFSAFFSFTTVEAGHIGLVRTFSDYTGEVGPGVNFKWPWQQVEEVTVRTQSKQIVMNEKLKGGTGSAVSRETQPVFATVTLNYSLESGAVMDLYREVGANYYSAIVEPRVLQVFKSETVKYSTIDVAPNREKIRRAVQGILDSQLEDYGIDVTDFLINDLDFADAFVNAITEKQVANQRAEAAREKVRQATFEANQKIETAKGDAQSKLITAKADAQANRLRASSLTPLVLEFERIQKWDPQIVYVPAGASIFVNPPPQPPSETP